MWLIFIETLCTCQMGTLKMKLFLIVWNCLKMWFSKAFFALQPENSVMEINYDYALDIGSSLFKIKIKKKVSLV